jgi:hypothetical protein
MNLETVIGIITFSSFFGCIKEPVNITHKIDTHISAISIAVHQATLIDDGTIKSSDYEEIGFIYGQNPNVTQGNGTIVISENSENSQHYAIAKNLLEQFKYYFKEYGRNEDTYFLSEESSFRTYLSENLVNRAGNSSDINYQAGVHSNRNGSFENSNYEVFSFGGSNATNTHLKEVWKYSPTLDKWTQVASSPEELGNLPGTITNGNNIYVISSYQENNHVFRYNTVTNLWSKKSDFKDFKINAQQIESFNYENISYMLATDDTEVKIYSYDGNTDTWELYFGFGFNEIPDLYFPKAIVSDSRVYFQPNIKSNDFYEFDMKSKILQKKNLPDVTSDNSIARIIGFYDGEILLAIEDRDSTRYLILFDHLSDPYYPDYRVLGSLNDLSIHNSFVIEGRIYFIDEQGVVNEFLP